MTFVVWTRFLFLSVFRHDYRVVLFLSCLWPRLLFMFWEIVYVQQETTAAGLGCQPGQLWPSGVVCVLPGMDGLLLLPGLTQSRHLAIVSRVVREVGNAVWV